MPSRAGSPNKVTSEFRERALKRFAERWPDWNPVMQMAEWANDETLDWDKRFAAVKELTPYILPRLKSVEHKGEVTHSVVLFKSDADL